MNALNCEKCAAPMGLAETTCHACGTPAPAGRAALILKTKAEAAYEQGALADAVRQLSKAMDSGMPQAEATLAWRKLGVWQEKLYAQEQRPELLLAAENSYRQAFSLNDSDDIAHQLFIAVTAKEGRMAVAAALYQERLTRNPDDTVAKKQLNVIKLTADIKAAPVPSRPKVAAEGGSLLERWLRPTPWKVWSLIASLVFSIIQLFTRPDAHDTSVLTSGDGVPLAALSIGSMFNDPWVVGLQAAIIALILFFMYRNRG